MASASPTFPNAADAKFLCSGALPMSRSIHQILICKLEPNPKCAYAASQQIIVRGNIALEA
jgi:hypothetical protein